MSNPLLEAKENIFDTKTRHCFAHLFNPGEFQPEKCFYPKALNATIHPIVKKFFNMKNELIINRYTKLNPTVDADVLKQMLEYKPKHFKWAGEFILYSEWVNLNYKDYK